MGVGGQDLLEEVCQLDQPLVEQVAVAEGDPVIVVGVGVVAVRDVGADEAQQDVLVADDEWLLAVLGQAGAEFADEGGLAGGCSSGDPDQLCHPCSCRWTPEPAVNPIRVR